MSFAGAAKHVKVLEGAGLVARRKAGRKQICTLNAGPLAEAEKWLAMEEILERAPRSPGSAHRTNKQRRRIQMAEAAAQIRRADRAHRCRHDPAQAHARCARRDGSAVSRRSRSSREGSWAVRMPSRTANSISLSIMTISRPMRSYPESHQSFKGAVSSEKVVDRAPGAAQRPPGRQERHGHFQLF